MTSSILTPALRRAPAVLLLAVLALTWAPAAHAEDYLRRWFAGMRDARQAQSEILAAAAGVDRPQFERWFAIGKDTTEPVTALPAARRAELASKLAAVDARGGLLRDYCLAMLASDRPAAAEAIVARATESSPRLAWNLLWCGCQSDVARLPRLADRWYERSLLEFARRGIRLDAGFPLISSPLLWLGKAAQTLAKAGDDQRVEELYRWMIRFGRNTEGLDRLDLRAASWLETRGDKAGAATARARAERLFDSPVQPMNRRLIYSADLGLDAGCVGLLLSLLIWGALTVKYRGCRVLYVERLGGPGGRFRRWLRTLAWPSFRFASRAELTTLLAAVFLCCVGFLVAANAVASVGRLASLPTAVLANDWADHEAVEYLEGLDSKSPERPIAGYLLAFSRLASGDAARAAGEFSGLVKDGGALAGDAEAWLNLGTALARQGKTDEARRAWSRASELGCVWGAFNLTGAMPSNLAGDDAVRPLAEAAGHGPLAIPPGPERVGELAMGSRVLKLLGSGHPIEAVREFTRRRLPLEPIAALTVGAGTLSVLSLLGILLGAPMRRCKCGAAFEVARSPSGQCESCASSAGWDDAEFLAPMPERFSRFAMRHLLALAVPGLKPLMRGAPAVGLLLLGLAALGFVAGTFVEAGHCHHGGGLGLFSGIMSTTLFTPMFGDASTLDADPLSSAFVLLVGWLIPLAYALNAGWLLWNWRRGD
jgi:tetratricopeptide (TPR) repeat protein